MTKSTNQYNYSCNVNIGRQRDSVRVRMTQNKPFCIDILLNLADGTCCFYKKEHLKICKFILTSVLNFLLETHFKFIMIFKRRTKRLPQLANSTLLVTKCLLQLTFLGPLLSPSEILIQGLTCHWQPCLAQRQACW